MIEAVLQVVLAVATHSYDGLLLTLLGRLKLYSGYKRLGQLFLYFLRGVLGSRVEDICNDVHIVLAASIVGTAVTVRVLVYCSSRTCWATCNLVL